MISRLHVTDNPHTPPVIKPRNYYISTTFDIPGLGNLMFQYASLLGIGRRNDHVPVMPFNNSLRQIFKLPIKTLNSTRPGVSWPQVIEIKASSYDSLVGVFHFDHDVEVVGYLQSYKYFEDVIPDVRHHFTFQDSISKQADDIIHKISQSYRVQKKPIQLIGIHVRRGDFLKPDFEKFGYTVADKQYIRHAMNYMENLLPDSKLVYIVCGSDVEWNKANIVSDTAYIHYQEDNSSEVDLAVLTKCDHMIMTVGTFGWWAGFLGRGQVIYYKNFPRNNSLLSNRAFSSDRRDYYPSTWIGLLW